MRTGGLIVRNSTLSPNDASFRRLKIIYNDNNNNDDRFDLEDFKYNSVNMTAFRLVDSGSEEVQKVLANMETVSPLSKAILNRSLVSLIL